MSQLIRLRPSIGITKTGIKVDQWNDPTSGITIEQLTALDRFDFVENYYNGHDAIFCDVSEFMEALNTTDLDGGTGDLSIILTVIPNDVLLQRDIIRKQVIGGTNAGWSLFLNDNDAPNGLFADGSNRRFLISSNITNFTNHTIIQADFEATPNTSSQYVDGATDEAASSHQGTVTGSMDNSEKFTVGDASLGYNGYILDIQIHSNLPDKDAKFAELDLLFSNPPIVPGGNGVRNRSALIRGVRI